MYQYEAAEQTLRKAIKLDYDDTQAYIELGNLYLKVDRVEEAITTFKRASCVDQESAETQQAIALAFMQKSEFDQAEKGGRSGG
jgi:Flp pilus assembly protein TadD